MAGYFLCPRCGIVTWKHLTIDNLEITTRTKNALELSGGLRRVPIIVLDSTPDAELLALRGMGKLSLANLREAIEMIKKEYPG